MLRCPNCFQMTVVNGRCSLCKMNATADLTLNETNLVALVENMKLRMKTVAPHEYQQMLGTFSARAGYDDGIYFTEPEIRITHRALVESDLLCVRVDSTVKLNTLRTLIIAHNEGGIQKALRDARREINRLKGSMRILRDLGEYAE